MDEKVHHGPHVHGGAVVHACPLVIFFVVFLVFTAIAFVVVKWSYHALVKYENAQQGDVMTRVARPASEIPKSLGFSSGNPEVSTLPQNAPMLQADPVKDMQAMRSEQEAKLSSYGWVDREKGVVHVPIDRAMTFVIERSMVKAQATEAAGGNAAPGATATAAPSNGTPAAAPAPATH